MKAVKGMRDLLPPSTAVWNHVEAAAHALGQEVDKMLRRRAGTEPKPHARPHEFDGAGGSGTLLSLDVHEGLGLPAPAKTPFGVPVSSRVPLLILEP